MERGGYTKMTINCTNINLQKGSKGDNVKTLQQDLTSMGFYDANIDGEYGSYTVTSVKALQKMFGLVSDGVVGSITCQKTNSLLDCKNTNLKRGSKDEKTKLVQHKLKQLGYYTREVDGDYGAYTESSVKTFQKAQSLKQDGIVGPVTCNKLLTITKKTTNTSSSSNGVYTNTKLCETRGGNCLGQITAYHCGPHSVKQALRKFGITGYSEKTIGSYAGTTTNGTGHEGLNTAIAKIARLEGVTLQVEWKNLSDLGSTTRERYKVIGEILSSTDKSCFFHLLYRLRYGHYEHVKTVNLNNNNLIVSNSLGDRCSSPAYCGYNESRGISTQNTYVNGISQRSVCIITKK